MEPLPTNQRTHVLVQLRHKRGFATAKVVGLTQKTQLGLLHEPGSSQLLLSLPCEFVSMGQAPQPPLLGFFVKTANRLVGEPLTKPKPGVVTVCLHAGNLAATAHYHL